MKPPKKFLAALRKSFISLKTAPEAAWDPKNSSENPPFASIFFAHFLGSYERLIDTGENKRSNKRGVNYEKGFRIFKLSKKFNFTDAK